MFSLLVMGSHVVDSLKTTIPSRILHAPLRKVLQEGQGLGSHRAHKHASAAAATHPPRRLQFHRLCSLESESSHRQRTSRRGNRPIPRAVVEGSGAGRGALPEMMCARPGVLTGRRAAAVIERVLRASWLHA